MDDRRKDIGFFKLFLSFSPVDFACLTRRRSPFEEDPGHRLGDDLDFEAKLAAELKAELDSVENENRWGVKTATVIQIRK
jgi:hypothetical protein